MTARILSAALVLLAAAPAVAQDDLNAAPSPLAARIAALRGDIAASPPADVKVAEAPAADGAADLELFIAASGETSRVGEIVTVTVTVANRGTVGAPDVQVAGPITARTVPAGLRLTAASSETGAFDPDEGLWYVGALDAAQEAALHLDFLVLEAGDYAFLTEVASAGIEDLDSTPYNGAQGEDDIGSAGFSARR